MLTRYGCLATLVSLDPIPRPIRRLLVGLRFGSSAANVGHTDYPFEAHDMKILVFAYQLVMSGTVVNAIELAAALRDLHGHDVVLFATPGPLVELAGEGHTLSARTPRTFPPGACAYAGHPGRGTTRTSRPSPRLGLDAVHQRFYSVHLLMRVPMVVTDMSMNLTRILPKRLPTTFGTPKIVDQARASGRRRVEFMLPPVDVHLNGPEAVDPRPFRERYGIEDGDVTLVRRFPG